jgi:hypothetical protein
MLAKASGLLAARLPPLESSLCAVELDKNAITPSRTEGIPKRFFLKNKNCLCKLMDGGKN